MHKYTYSTHTHTHPQVYVFTAAAERICWFPLRERPLMVFRKFSFVLVYGEKN